MRIPEQILYQCHIHGVETYPEESCGFIVGNIEDFRSLETVYPMRNIMNEMHKKDPKNYPRTSRDGFLIDPSEQIKLERFLKKIGKKIKIIYHSHPDVGAYFSDKDKEEALWNGKERFPGINFLVCATNNGKPGNAIIAKFNNCKKDFDIIKIPKINLKKSFGMLGGIFGISGIIPSLDFIHEWKNGNLELEYGYFRFIPPKQVKNLQKKFAVLYQIRNSLAYSSGRSALMELLNYLREYRALTNINLVSNSKYIADSISSLVNSPKVFKLNNLPKQKKISPKDNNIILIAPENLKSFLKENSDWLWEIKKINIPIIVFEEVNFDFSNMSFKDELSNFFSFRVIGLAISKSNNFHNVLTGGMILSNNDRQMSELFELRKKRGYILSARNAELFSEKFSANSKNNKTLLKIYKNSEKKRSHFHEEAILKQLCKWENASSGLLFPSGMAAITTLVDFFSKKNPSRLIVIGLLYSETYSLLMDYGKQSTFEVIFLGLNELDLLPELLKDDTTMVITETITNPLCGVPDLERIGKLANSRGVPFLVDNTLASPANCQPIDWGADFVIHSTTKYLCGTNDHAGGAILIKCQDKAKELEKFQKIWSLQISPLEAKILHQRIHDFEERMTRFNKNNLEIVNFLKSHSSVDRIYYAFSPSNISNSITTKMLSGCGGVVSFILKNNNEDNLKKFYDGKFDSIIKAPTLGSNQTLICPYTMLTHYHDSDKDLLEINLPRYLIRIASGSEKKIDPVISDLHSALDRTS